MRRIGAVSLAVLLAGGALGAVALAFTTGNARGQETQLTVTPNSGPVGTSVVLEGTGCALEGAQPLLVFQGAGTTGTATEGADEIRNIAIDGQGHFRITYTIPSAFGPGSLQGRGGGPINPGNYEFISKPPICTALFVVTGGLPRTGQGPQVSGGPAAPVSLLIAGAVAMVAGFLAVAAARRIKVEG